MALTLHPGQMQVARSRARFRVVVAGRRWGKCLASGTLISMADGTQKAIENVVPGDLVLTVNESSYVLEPRVVQRVMDNGVRDVLRVTTRSGQQICATPNHPLLANNHWTEARNLKVGDLLAITREGVFGDETMPLVDGDIAWDEIVFIEDFGEAQTWDLQIQGNHNFIANNIVSHNTRLALAEIIKWAANRRKQKIWYVAPTYRMAKSIMWDDLLEAIPKQWIVKINETLMTIRLKNGSIVECKGADKPDTLRGVGLHFVVLDEFQDMKIDTWVKVISPTLATTNGECLFIGTPKSFNQLYEVYEKGQRPDYRQKKLWESWQFPTITSPFIPLEEIETQRRNLDEKSFKQEFEACHLSDTAVMMWSGKLKRIADVKPGDVVCHLREDGVVEPCDVLRVGETGSKSIVDVVLETGEVISASAHHKFKIHVSC